MRIYGVQTDIEWERKSINHERVHAMLESLGPEPGSLVVLPEMFATGFSMNVSLINDAETLETERFLSDRAAALGVYLLGGVVVADGRGRGRNQCVIYSPEGVEIARYSKIRPFTLGGEADHYDAGEQVVVFECGGFRVSPFICYDLRFPELFRAAALRGANLITVIASWPEVRISHWETLLRARAIENQCYVVGVNRTGVDPNSKYSGRSMIIDPGGEVLADAGKDEGVISAGIDCETVGNYRRTLPFLADMHPEILNTRQR
ncbi:MAG: carbon-nitrogen family hydrolase [Acidobacteria bacterium]|nr:carbon-nitrogen family hydrolase [Acidobacteriota bacterium]